MRQSNLTATRWAVPETLLPHWRLSSVLLLMLMSVSKIYKLLLLGRCRSSRVSLMSRLAVAN